MSLSTANYGGPLPTSGGFRPLPADPLLPTHFRRALKVLDLPPAGRSVASLSADLGVSDQTMYNWRPQDAIDRGLDPGLTSADQAGLPDAGLTSEFRISSGLNLLTRTIQVRGKKWAILSASRVETDTLSMPLPTATV